MKLLCTFFFIAAIFTNLGAQKKARDFKVTTTDLRSIELYKDYLNKGKVVLLKIFFVDCPPCNEIAPHISQLYKKYGSGNQSVEFIELSNQAWDNNSAVTGYKIKYDLPCPSVSNDGGSVQAAALYSDNFYGPYYGTPTFAVIKPDGTVNFDPRGSTRNETVTRLDTALAQALRTIIIPPVDTSVVKPPVDTMKPPVDTMKPKPPVDSIKVPVDSIKIPIIDTVKFFGRLVSNGAGLGLVPLTLTWNSKPYKFTTDIGGNFKIFIVDSGKTTNEIRLTIDYHLDFLTGISAIDLVLIQKHILGIVPFSHYRQLLAADADLSGDINAIDLVELKKLILGLYDKLPKAPSVHFAWENQNHFIRTLVNLIPHNEIRNLGPAGMVIEVVKVGNVN